MNINYGNLPSDKIKFLKEIFIPTYKSGKQEKVVGVTTKELCDFYKKQRKIGILLACS